MDAAREIPQYVIAGQVDRRLNSLRHHGFFFMFVAISFLIQAFGRSTTDNCGLFTAFFMLIVGIWMVIVSFLLHMFPWQERA